MAKKPTPRSSSDDPSDEIRFVITLPASMAVDLAIIARHLRALTRQKDTCAITRLMCVRHAIASTAMRIEQERLNRSRPQ